MSVVCGAKLADGRTCGREMKKVTNEDGEQEWRCALHPPETATESQEQPLSFVDWTKEDEAHLQADIMEATKE